MIDSKAQWYNYCPKYQYLCAFCSPLVAVFLNYKKDYLTLALWLFI